MGGLRPGDRGRRALGRGEGGRPPPRVRPSDCRRPTGDRRRRTPTGTHEGVIIISSRRLLACGWHRPGVVDQGSSSRRRLGGLRRRRSRRLTTERRLRPFPRSSSRGTRAKERRTTTRRRNNGGASWSPCSWTKPEVALAFCPHRLPPLPQPARCHHHLLSSTAAPRRRLEHPPEQGWCLDRRLLVRRKQRSSRSRPGRSIGIPSPWSEPSRRSRHAPLARSTPPPQKR